MAICERFDRCDIPDDCGPLDFCINIFALSKNCFRFLNGNCFTCNIIDTRDKCGKTVIYASYGKEQIIVPENVLSK